MLADNENNEKRPLLRQNRYKELFDKNHDAESLSPDVRAPFCKYVIEPIIVLMCASFVAHSAVMGQYIYFVVGQQYHNGSHNTTVVKECSLNVNHTLPEYILEEKIQEEATLWNTWISLSSGSLAIITTPLMAVYSDKLGRKLPLIMFTTAETIKASINFLVIYFNWPLWIFVITSLFSGLGGGFGTLFSACFSYIGDISTKKDRAFRIALVEMSFGVCTVATSLFIGYFINITNGYVMPYIFCTTCVAVCWIYTILVLPEVREPSRERMKVWHQLTQLVKVHTKENRNTVAFVGLLVALFFYGICLIGTSSLEQIYEMNYPFCMDSILLGYYSAASTCIMQLGLLIAAKLLTRCMPILAVAIVGCISAIAHKLMMGLATSTVMLMTSPALGIFVLTPIPMIRAYMSVQIPGSEQGALFASIGFVEILCQIVGSFLFNAIYYSTLQILPGFVFFTSCISYSITIMIISFVLLRDIKRKKAFNSLLHTSIQNN